MGLSNLRPVIEDCEEIVPIAQLAEEHYRKTGWPLRIAVDEADWRFHNLTEQQVAFIRKSEPAANPIEKAFFHRICKLLTLNIRLIFVFDGPDAPPKYGRTEGRKVNRPRRQLLMRILDGLGITHIEALGEAEAECCRLQALDLVDAVWSQDSDCLMFGCTFWIRDHRVTKEGKTGKHNADTEKVERMVRVVRAEVLKEKHRLDREGCAVFAMLAGGDYDSRGLLGLGAENAIKAAKAGIGKSLCRKQNQQECQEWRVKVLMPFLKLQSINNTVPEHFPSFKTLTYYKNPKMHSDEELKNMANMDKPINELELLSVGCSAMNIYWKPYLEKVGPILLSRFLANREESMAKEVLFDIRLTKTRTKKNENEPQHLALERTLEFMPMNVTSITEERFRGWISNRPRKPWPPFDSMHRAKCEIPIFLLERLLPEEILNPSKATPAPKPVKRKIQTEDIINSPTVSSVKKTKTKSTLDTVPSASKTKTVGTPAAKNSAKVVGLPSPMSMTNTSRTARSERNVDTPSKRPVHYMPLGNVDTPSKRPIQNTPIEPINNVIVIDDSDDDQLRLPIPRVRK